MLLSWYLDGLMEKPCDRCSIYVWVPEVAEATAGQEALTRPETREADSWVTVRKPASAGWVSGRE